MEQEKYSHDIIMKIHIILILTVCIFVIGCSDSITQKSETLFESYVCIDNSRDGLTFTTTFERINKNTFQLIPESGLKKDSFGNDLYDKDYRFDVTGETEESIILTRTSGNHIWFYFINKISRKFVYGTFNERFTQQEFGNVVIVK